VGGEPGGTSAPIHALRYLVSPLRREGLIADELVLQLATFLRSLDLFLELMVLAARTLTANQARHGAKQGTDNPEHSRIHSSTCRALTSLPRSFPAQRLTISLTSRSFWSAQTQRRRLLRSQSSTFLSPKHLGAEVHRGALAQPCRDPFIGRPSSHAISKINNHDPAARKATPEARAIQRPKGRSACEMQKISAGKFHLEPPFTSFDHLVGAREYR
jgi:hypothetical protein